MTDLQFGIILATIVLTGLVILAIMWEYERIRNNDRLDLYVRIDKAALEADSRERAAGARTTELHRTLEEISTAMRVHHLKTREMILGAIREQHEANEVLHRDSQRALAGALERLAATIAVPARYTVPAPQAATAPTPQKLEWIVEEEEPPAPPTTWEEARERGKAERATRPPEEAQAEVGPVSDFDDILRLAQQKETAR